MKTRLVIFAFLSCIVAIGILTLFLERRSLPSLFYKPHIVAHHGSVKNFPENTIETLERAVKYGATVVEVDVQLSKDGVLVAFREELLEKTTNGTGPVHSSSLAELKSLDAAYNLPQYKGKGMKIATLEEIALWIDHPAQESVLLALDLQLNATFRLVRKLNNLYKKHPQLHKKSMVVSYEPHILYAVRRNDKDIATSLIVRHDLISEGCKLRVLNDLFCQYSSPLVNSWLDILAEELYLWVVPYFTGSNGLVIHNDALPTLNQIKGWSASGWWINVFDVPTPKRSQKLLSLGVSVAPSVLPIVTGGNH